MSLEDLQTVRPKRKQSSIDLQTKLKVLEEVDYAVSKKKIIIENFVIAKSTLFTIIKDWEKNN